MRRIRSEAVVMGASAGALDALSSIIPNLPRGYPLPVLVVVHLPPDRESILAEILQARCLLAVKEAEDKEPILGGTVYLAPPDYHLQVERSRTLSLSRDEAVWYSRPSIDVLFETAADAYGSAVVAVVLTGANEDGSNGAASIDRAGGTVLVQEPATAPSPTMPAAALKACSSAIPLSLQEIVKYLTEAANL